MVPSDGLVEVFASIAVLALTDGFGSLAGIPLNGLSLPALAGILLGTVTAVLLAPSAFEAIRRLIHKARARERLVGQSKKGLRSVLFEDLCRNGIPFLRPLASRLLRIRKVDAWCARISTALGSKVPVVSKRSICELELAASALVALFLFVISGQLIFALLGVILPVWFSSHRASVWYRTCRAQLREQLPDALNALGMCFSAGLSLQQALAQISNEIPDPLGRQLSLAVHDIDVGYGVSEALERLEQRTNCSDLRFVLVALDIQHMTGGSLREILEGAAASISESFDLVRSLEVQTAQARMSARIVTIMPLALLAVLSLIMPGYLASFFSSTTGLMLLVGALGLEALGVVLIRRILGIDLK
ncbi:MAG: type II secretion system F family protein [Coriobacteriia bacterium]|nr:type II secretion system F family protein [Coriobacteriia bacterium]